MVEGVAAVVLSAGKGVRMVSEEAKVLHPLCGMPMLGHVLKAVAKCGPERTLVVVGHQAQTVMGRFSDWGVEFVVQEEQRGTGHALMQAEGPLTGFTGEVLVLPYHPSDARSSHRRTSRP
jgi:bifunctional N-acetylglucosamine-1-phosphate-uridyltransferase/glucosamine-1-phosphate-acetyltransferase GlmU-like protein